MEMHLTKKSFQERHRMRLSFYNIHLEIYRFDETINRILKLKYFLKKDKMTFYDNMVDNYILKILPRECGFTADPEDLEDSTFFVNIMINFLLREKFSLLCYRHGLKLSVSTLRPCTWLICIHIIFGQILS